ncbi:MAG: phage tail tape measure protein [Defluviitaleaceae bacterium]|nr:phage tail tape measure protein [Defluviitaleaceae bacterium]
MAASETIRYAGVKLTVDGAAEFKKSLGEINRNLSASQAELNKVTAAYGRNEKNVETLTAQKNHLNNAIEANLQEQERLAEMLEKTTEEMGANSREAQTLATKLANTEAKGIGLTRQLGAVTAALEEQERALRGQAWIEFGEKMEAAGQKMQAAGQKMQSAGKTLSIAVTAPLVAMGVQSLRVGADFEASMNTIQAKTGMAAYKIDKLGLKIRAMAKSGEYGTFSARQISNALAGVSTAGDDVYHSVELMRYSMVLATATNTDLATATGFLNLALVKNQAEIYKGERYINAFAAVARESGMSMGNLEKAIIALAPTMNVTGKSIEAMSGKLNILYRGGIYGINAARGIEQITNALISGGDAMDTLGVSAFDLETGALRPLNETLKELMYSLDDVATEQERYNLQNDLFSTVYSRAVFNELKNNREAWLESIEVMYEATAAIDGTGIAFQMAAKEQSGLSATAQQVRASFEEVKLQISDQLMPHALRLVDGIGNLVQRFASLDEGTQRTIVRLAGVAAVTGPVLVISGKLITTVGKVTSAFGAASIAMGKAGGLKALWATKQVPLSVKANAALIASMVKLKTAIATTTKATAASIKTYGLKATGMKALSATTGGLKAALGGLKIAFAAVKKALIATGIGAIVVTIGVAVAGLTAGIAALIARANKLGEAYETLADDTAQLTQRQYELITASAEAAEKFQQNISILQTNAEHYRGLADSIAYLTSKQELSAGEMELLERHIAELNESVPNLALAFDAQTGSLNMTVDAMNAYLKAAEGRAAMDAMLQEELRLRQEAISLEHEFMQVATKRGDLEEKLNDGTNRRRADRRALEAALQDLITAEENYKTAMETNADAQATLTAGIEIHADALRELEAAQQEAQQAIADATAEIENQARKSEEWAKAQEDALNKINSAFEGYKRITTNVFRTISEAAAVSVQELTANLQDNARAVEEWSKNIAILTERGVDEGLLQQLRDAGPEAAATVRQLVDASDKELEALNYAFEESTRIAVESMKRQLDPAGVANSAEELIDHVAGAILANQGMEDALVNQVTAAFDTLSSTVSTIGFDQAGKNAVNGFTNGVVSMLRDVENAGENVGENLLKSLNRELESNSPSRATHRTGVNAGQGVINGTQEMQPRVVETAQTLARAFIDAIATKISTSQDVNNSIRRQIEEMRRVADNAVAGAVFDNVGFNMSSGVARGIQNGGGMVSNAAQNLISNALSAMRAAAAINSPSRETMEIADSLGDGLIVRMKAKGDELVAVCKKITNNVLNSLTLNPDGIIKSSGDAIRNMQNALPAMQSHIKKAVYPQPIAATQPTKLPDIIITGNQFNIREEDDITKVAKEVMRLIGDKVSDEGRIGGVAFSW